MTHTCAICEKSFESKSTQSKYCSRDCFYEGKRKNALIYYHDNFVSAKDRREAEKAKARPMSLDEFNLEAKSQNLSYGQYDAKLRMEELRKSGAFAKCPQARIERFLRVDDAVINGSGGGSK